MLRAIYLGLLGLHPPVFREQFAAGMLDIFDRAEGRAARLRLIVDGLVSLIRQWGFRSEFRQPALAVAAGGVPDQVPAFHTMDSYRPRPAALAWGGFLAMATLTGVGVVIPMGGHSPRFLIGVHRPGLGLLPVARSSLAESELNTVVVTGPAWEDPLRPLTSAYFRVIRVLGAIDADGDLILTPWELATAPAALRKLDADHDGRLSPEECGLRTAGMPAGMAARARVQFMRLNPVLAALDADGDGVISAAEIANSYTALKKLDRNGDGSLTADELLPDSTLGQAAAIMIRLDIDGDGVLSPAEQQAIDATPLRGLLSDADRDRDGVVTLQELRAELRLRAEQKRELEGARRAAGYR